MKILTSKPNWCLQGTTIDFHEEILKLDFEVCYSKFVIRGLLFEVCYSKFVIRSLLFEVWYSKFVIRSLLVEKQFKVCSFELDSIFSSLSPLVINVWSTKILHLYYYHFNSNLSNTIWQIKNFFRNFFSVHWRGDCLFLFLKAALCDHFNTRQFVMTLQTEL